MILENHCIKKIIVYVMCRIKCVIYEMNVVYNFQNCFNYYNLILDPLNITIFFLKQFISYFLEQFIFTKISKRTSYHFHRNIACL